MEFSAFRFANLRPKNHDKESDPRDEAGGGRGDGHHEAGIEIMI